MNSTVGPLGNSNPVGALVNSSPAVPLINSTPAVNNNPRVPLETVSKPEIKPEPLSTSPEPLDEDALDPTSLLRQINQLGPSERCSPIQAGSMGKKLLTIIAYHEQNNLSLPGVCMSLCVCELCQVQCVMCGVSVCVCVV